MPNIVSSPKLICLLNYRTARSGIVSWWPPRSVFRWTSAIPTLSASAVDTSRRAWSRVSSDCRPTTSTFCRYEENLEWPHGVAICCQHNGECRTHAYLSYWVNVKDTPDGLVVILCLKSKCLLRGTGGVVLVTESERGHDVNLVRVYNSDRTHLV